MPNKKLPKDIVDHWPEVLKDVRIDTIPIEYLTSLRIEFKDGKVWEVDCQAKKNIEGNLTDALAELFETYEREITNVDFRLNTAKVKRDIQKKTRAFLKNPRKSS